MAALTVHQSHKKRGRKPKLRLSYEEDDGGDLAEPYAKRSRIVEETVTRRSQHHRERSDHGLIQLTKRFQEETTITPRACSEQRHVGGAGLSYSCAFRSDVRQSDQVTHRTGFVTPVSHHREPKHHEEQQVKEYRPASVVDTGSISDSSAVSSWTPCFSHLDTVTVTDITMNFLTVTVRESSTDKGFFKEKR